MGDDKSIGNRIEKLADIAGSQKELARIAGVPDSTLINWKRGLGIRESKLREAARNMGVDAIWFSEGKGDEEAQLVLFQMKRAKTSHNAPREKLLDALKERGMTPTALAKKIKYDAGVINNVVNGTGRASEAMIEAIVRELPELSKEDLMNGGSDVPVYGDSPHGIHGQAPSVTLPPGMTGRMVPLLSMAQAGAWDAGYTDEGWNGAAVFALNVDDRRAFAIKVMGNSMEPDIYEGDIVICSPTARLTPGCCAVVRTRHEYAYIKYWRQKADVVILESANSKSYDPIRLPASDIVGAWPVVQRISSVMTRKQTV